MLRINFDSIIEQCTIETNLEYILRQLDPVLRVAVHQRRVVSVVQRVVLGGRLVLHLAILHCTPELC